MTPMVPSDPPTDYERPQEPRPNERRREARLVFSRKCHLTVTSPVWAITTRPLQGLTENITSVGLRVKTLRTDPGQAQAWKDAIRQDADVRVEVSLPELENFPRLHGSIVWVHTSDRTEDGGDPLLCAVGVLFSILSERERLALGQLIASATREDSEFT